ncbi:MAG: F0F1 ATP synthase subunit alpha [Clostridia bacterium]|nr:F0F1 ATP synthase subunit alpha [Clostridia bacterium]
MRKMTNNSEKRTAKLFSATAPKKEYLDRFVAFVRGKYGEDTAFVWVKDETLGKGFRLEVGAHIYDWTEKGLLSQFEAHIREMRHTSDSSIIPLLRDSVQSWTPQILAEEIGEVLTVGDGIATVAGLEHATYGEILLFDSGIRGMVQQLDRDKIGCILFGDSELVVQGSEVKRTGKTAGMPVGDAFVGRVIDALGNAIDGRGAIPFTEYRPIENPAPSIIDRQSVNEPMETGILTIDSMFPIGKGQRELIIGDRQTGKTAIAVDAILNQKGKNVICIYVAIGQKASSVSQLVENLTMRGAMDYTIVVTAGASDSASLQYIAPYAGCALGEYFMEKGRDVLIVYDDLSKHAVAYRALSLLLERSPGREAYPGDVFYLHSRLLERAAHLSDARGGGSMTALPIVETQAGDVSAYIPTNIISITDGQIFLESGLFFSGQRPAVNVGLSVSRVGSAAQTKALKSAVGTLRLDLSQYREMEVFTQFSSDLDENTQNKLTYGKGLMYLLRQSRYEPLSQFEQTVLLVVALGRVLQDIPFERIDAFRRGFLAHIERTAPELHALVKLNAKVDADVKEQIIDLAKQYKENAGFSGDIDG